MRLVVCVSLLLAGCSLDASSSLGGATDDGPCGGEGGLPITSDAWPVAHGASEASDAAPDAVDADAVVVDSASAAIAPFDVGPADASVAVGT